MAASRFSMQLSPMAPHAVHFQNISPPVLRGRQRAVQLREL